MSYLHTLMSYLHTLVSYLHTLVLGQFLNVPHCRDLLDKYVQCKTPSQVISCQQQWLAKEQEKQLLARQREGQLRHYVFRFFSEGGGGKTGVRSVVLLLLC